MPSIRKLTSSLFPQALCLYGLSFKISRHNSMLVMILAIDEAQYLIVNGERPPLLLNGEEGGWSTPPALSDCRIVTVKKDHELIFR